MLSRTFISMTYIVLLVAGFASQPVAAQQGLTVLEIRFAEADSLLTEVVAERDSLAAEAGRLAGEIAALKARGKLNYFQRGRLESLLRSSQELSRRLDAAERRVADRQRRVQELGSKLLDQYQAAIETRLAQLERVAAGERPEQAAELETLRRKQAQLRQRLEQPGPVIRLIPVEIDPHDSPAEIRQKADLLRDQEDKLRARQRWLELKAAEISDELELRQRMSEFVDEVALFDPSEEGLTSEAMRAAILPTPKAVDRAMELATGTAQAPGVFLSPRQWEALVSPGHFSEAELMELLETLKKERQKLSSQADSLRQVSKQFMEKATAYEAGKEPEPK